MENINQYVSQIFQYFVFPGILGGLGVGFSVYILTLGISLGYKLIADFANVEPIEND